MLALKIECFLARLYTEPKLLANFIAAPNAVLSAEGFTSDEILLCGDWDFQGLLMAAASYQYKRKNKYGFWHKLTAVLKRWCKPVGRLNKVDRIGQLEQKTVAPTASK